MFDCVSARPRWYWMYAQAASALLVPLTIEIADPPSFESCEPFGPNEGSGMTPQSPAVFGASQLFRNVPIQTAMGSVATLPSLIVLYQGSVHSDWSEIILPRHIFPIRF